MIPMETNLKREFCGEKCKRKNEYWRYREHTQNKNRKAVMKARAGRFCIVCGDPIPLERRVNARSCSPRCATKKKISDNKARRHAAKRAKG